MDRQSICATCLSQDRKLISVSKLQEFVKFYSKLSLTQTDMVCWECHHMMQRTVTFIHRAQKAQAWLQNAWNKDCKFRCLSTLGISKPIHLTNTDIELTSSEATVPKPLFVAIKEDIDDETEAKSDSGREFQVKDEIEVEIEMPTKKVIVEDLNVEEHTAATTLKHNKELINPTMYKSGHINMVHNMFLPINTIPMHNAGLPTSLMYTTGLPINTVQQLPSNTIGNMGLPINVMPNIGLHNNTMYMGLPSNMMHMHNAEQPYYTVFTHNNNALRNIRFQNKDMHLHNLPINTAHNTRRDINAMHNTELPATELRKIVLPFSEMHEQERPSTKNRKIEDVPLTTTTGEPDFIYTEEPLDEEGLVKWRERKRAMSSFALRAPEGRCDMCIEQFYTQTQALKHAKTHTELHGDMECDICKQRAATEEDLENHRRLHYRILKCRYCGYEWDDANSMREHCRDAHNIKQTVWDCELCKRPFPSNEKLRKHMRNHRRVRCKECGRQVLEVSLRTHMINLKPSTTCGPSFTLYCSQCQLQSQSPAAFRLHMTTLKHIPRDQYDFQCDVCKNKFRTKNLLEQHIKRVHLDRIKNSLEEHLNIHAGLRPHQCPRCPATFAYKAALYTHNRLKHLKIKGKWKKKVGAKKKGKEGENAAEGSS